MRSISTHRSDDGFGVQAVLIAIALMAVIGFAFSYANRGGNATTSTQSNQAIASTIVTVGNNLQTGFKTMQTKGWADSQILFNGAPGPTASPGQPAFLASGNALEPTELFHPVYGAAAAPARPEPAMATNGANDVWLYNSTLIMTGVGTGTSGNIVAILPSLKLAICQAINNILYNDSLTATPFASALALAAWQTGTGTTATVASGAPRQEGCIQSSDGNNIYFKALSIH